MCVYSHTHPDISGYFHTPYIKESILGGRYSLINLTENISDSIKTLIKMCTFESPYLIITGPIDIFLQLVR